MMHQKMLDLILIDAVAYTDHNAQASIMDKWSKEQLTFALAAMSTRLRILRNALHRDAPIDAGLRFKPVLERASNTPEGWTAEMEQAHDGEWIHIGSVSANGEPR